jgi:hypothetical protein
LQGCYSRGLTRVFLASAVMATSFLCSPASVEIRQLVLHTYPAGSKVPGAERFTVFFGRRGKPVKKPRFLPASPQIEQADQSFPAVLGAAVQVLNH